MKHPPVQYPDEMAKEMVEKFIQGDGAEAENAKRMPPPGDEGKIDVLFIFGWPGSGDAPGPDSSDPGQR